jgi:hypothetical protein
MERFMLKQIKYIAHKQQRSAARVSECKLIPAEITDKLHRIFTIILLQSHWICPQTAGFSFMNALTVVFSTGLRFPVRQEFVPFATTFRYVLGPTQPPTQWILGALSPEIMWSEFETPCKLISV